MTLAPAGGLCKGRQFAQAWVLRELESDDH